MFFVGPKKHGGWWRGLFGGSWKIIFCGPWLCELSRQKMSSGSHLDGDLLYEPD